MGAQLLPEASQRYHWYAYVIGWVPVQVPGATVSFSSCFAFPVMVGGAVFDGFVAAGAVTGPVMTGVSSDSALEEPAAFVAVTRTLFRPPTSYTTGL
jgi:hypothetical protein